jgi:hypothetical protein
MTLIPFRFLLTETRVLSLRQTLIGHEPIQTDPRKKKGVYNIVVNPYSLHASKLASSSAGNDTSHKGSPTIELQTAVNRSRNVTTSGTTSDVSTTNTNFSIETNERQITEQNGPITRGQRNLLGLPEYSGLSGLILRGGDALPSPSGVPINSESETSSNSMVSITARELAELQTIKTIECLQCLANPYLAENNKCPVTFRDYKSMRIHVQQDHTHLEPQPAICICSLTNVPTSDACKEPGCAWFFVDDISDDTTLADWYPGMNKHEQTRPYPLPFPCPAMPYLDPDCQCPARFSNVEDMRVHGLKFHKVLLPHEPVC